MSFSNKILYFAVILVWIAVVFKGTYLNKLRLYVKEGTELLDETFLSGVDGKGGGRGGGGASRGGSSSRGGGGIRASSFFRSSASSSGISSGYRSSYRSYTYRSSSYRSSYGYTPTRPVLTAQLQNEANDKMKILAAKIAITGAMVSVAGPAFFYSSNRYAYTSGHYYYDYDYRSVYSEINGSICTNNQTYNEIIFGQFVCPIEGFHSDDTLCCGTAGYQFCCGSSSLDFEDYLAIFFIIIGLFILLCFAGFNLFYNRFKHLFHSKKETNEPLIN